MLVYTTHTQLRPLYWAGGACARTRARRRRSFLARAHAAVAPRPHFDFESLFQCGLKALLSTSLQVEVVLLQKTLVRRQVGPTRAERQARAHRGEAGGGRRVSALPRRGRALPEAFLESVLGGEGRGSRNHFWRVDSPHARGLRCRVVGPARPSAPPRRSSAAFVQGRLQRAGRALLGPHRLLRVGRVLCCGRRPFPRKEGGAEPRTRHVLPRGYQCKPPLAPWAESTAFAGTGSNRLALDAAARRRALGETPP